MILEIIDNDDWIVVYHDSQQIYSDHPDWSNLIYALKGKPYSEVKTYGAPEEDEFFCDDPPQKLTDEIRATLKDYS